MKLGKKKMLLVSFMLFSLFFGAGNLIFPPFLGQNAGEQMPLAILGFLITAVALPVLGVIVVARFDGLDKLSQKVGVRFSIIFTILIYLSIGPGLGIPRAASVPFEMAVAPYLPKEASVTVCMVVFSFIFFILAGWLAMTPNKLVERIGKFLTPTLLLLLVFVFINYVFRGEVNVVAAQEAYAGNPLAQGFLEGYQTMDTIAALNFGLVIATTITGLGIESKKGVMRYTVRAGVFAGTILSLVYLMLSYMGMGSSGVFPIQENGAWTLRCIVEQLFGGPGAVLLAVIFTLACLTTCVGLITSISQYFSTLTKKISYAQWVFLISGFSFLVCNQGLNTILGLSMPVLNAIYPISIMLIVLGICDRWIKNNPYIYSCTIAAVGCISIIYVLDKQLKVPLGFLSDWCHALPLYSMGLGWVAVAIAAAALTGVLYVLKKR
ncbi:MAG: branched-chain amino acid transport system II carrier protein [Bacillota bacterium]|nr:branched-chain amino acid transport system II carrier protein [Bacillota bacterium]